MEGIEFEGLCADIKAHGLQEAIWEFEGKILDGRNRSRACHELGMEIPDNLIGHFERANRASGSYRRAEGAAASPSQRRELYLFEDKDVS
jgi:hypothetical protein